MRILIQRVKNASVKADGSIKGRINKGILAFVGFGIGDDESILLPMAQKMAGLRIFTDSDGKMNLTVSDIGGEIMVISQFTLYADCKKGRRPSFTRAKNPSEANRLYEGFVKICGDLTQGKVNTGVFGADMKVELLNDGPVTIMLDSDEILKKG